MRPNNHLRVIATTARLVAGGGTAGLVGMGVGGSKRASRRPSGTRTRVA
jgi:hypothetical protein